jgi:hypothetical protein
VAVTAPEPQAAAPRPVRSYTGVLVGPVTIQDELVVNGAVEGRVRVTPGGSLTVRGTLGGELVVDRGGVVKVEGAFSGRLILSSGLLMVAGLVTGEPWKQARGRVALAAGTIVTSHGSWVMLPSGRMGKLASGRERHVGPETLYLEFRYGSWEPMPDPLA